MSASPSHTVSTGSWTFSIGAEFELIDNGNSVQAVDGSRVVYVSSLSVGNGGHPVPVTQLRAAALKRLGSGERLSHTSGAAQGDAEILPIDGGWRLQGTMCRDGTIATCVIDYGKESERTWAISVWTSLLCSGERL